MPEKLIVLSSPRSGTNFLVSLLNSHPNIYMYGELFQPFFYISNPNKTIFENKLFFYFYKYLRSKFPILFLNYIYNKTPKDIQIIGFKIFYEHAKSKGLVKVWRYLKEDKNIKVIHLKRQNLLKSYVSLLLALKTKDFYKSDAKQIDQQSKLFINYSKCLRYFKKIEKLRKTYDETFSDHPKINVNYEALCKSQDKVTAGMLKFLKVVNHKLTSPFVKQNRSKLSEVIINYQELKKCFKGSKWSIFFE